MIPAIMPTAIRMYKTASLSVCVGGCGRFRLRCAHGECSESSTHRLQYPMCYIGAAVWLNAQINSDISLKQLCNGPAQVNARPASITSIPKCLAYPNPCSRPRNRPLAPTSKDRHPEQSPFIGRGCGASSQESEGGSGRGRGMAQLAAGCE